MRACDTTKTKALNTIGHSQSKSTETTRMWSNWLLNYLATHPDAKIRYLAKRHEITNPLRLIAFSGMGCKKQLRRVFLPQIESEWRRAPKKQRSSRRQRIPYPPCRYQSQRQNSGERFIMKKRERYYASPWKKWVGNKDQPRSLLTITWRAEFATSKSIDNNRERWTANIFG